MAKKRKKNSNSKFQFPKINLRFIKKYFFLIFLLFFLPVLVLAVKFQYDNRTKAYESNILPERIEISPGEIILESIPSNPIHLSALAYDINNEPIWTGVNYTWGISSNYSVGTIDFQNDLAVFYPKNNGAGDLYVVAQTAVGKTQKSIKIKIGPIINECLGEPDGISCVTTVCPKCPKGKMCPDVYLCKEVSGVCQKEVCVKTKLPFLLPSPSPILRPSPQP